jgi:saccharopine dehydrogenase-like NADP-dependent oxidoreductase
MDTNGHLFAGKVAFITGGASGIGRAAALAVARQGASVVVADVSEQGNQETARLIEHEGGRALAVRCDVTRAHEVQAALDKPWKSSAGSMPPSTTRELSRRTRHRPRPTTRRSGIGSSISISEAS